MHLISSILLRLLGLPSSFESTHTHTHTGGNSHTKASETGSPSNETRHSKVLRMHFFSPSSFLFFSMVRYAAANATNALRFFSHDVSFNEHRLHRVHSHSHAERCSRTKMFGFFLVGKKMPDFAYCKIYSPFKSFVNCDRVDMIAWIQFVFVEIVVELWFGCSNPFGTGERVQSIFLFLFLLRSLPSASQFLSCKYYSFLLFGTNTRAHLADDATTTRPCTFHVHPNQIYSLGISKLFRSISLAILAVSSAFISSHTTHGNSHRCWGPQFLRIYWQRTNEKIK